MVRLLIITDAVHPQVNGVVTMYENFKSGCKNINNLEIECLTPNQFKTIPLWFYPEIHGVINPFPVYSVLRKKKFDAVHIATEGPIGLVARLYFSFKRIPFTTAYHTKIPACLKKYLSIPIWVTGKIIAWYHRKSEKVLAVAESGVNELRQYGVTSDIHVWRTGINRDLFKFCETPIVSDLPRPIFAFFGRVSHEKDIHEFLEMELPGSKLVVGDGPIKELLEKQFPETKFVGYKFGKELADYFASADVFVFPGKTEALGLVVLESIATGTPVAAYDVDGPKEVILSGVSGFVGDDLRASALACLDLDRRAVADCSKQWDLNSSSRDFLNQLAWIDKKPDFSNAD